MKKSILNIAIIAGLSAGLFACSNSIEQQQSPNAASTTNTQIEKSSEESKKLAQIFDNFFQDSIKMSPIFGTYVGHYESNNKFNDPISPESIAAQLAFQESYLQQIQQIDASQLVGQDLLSYQIFLRDRTLAIKGFDFKSQLIPLNQMYGIHNSFASMGSGTNSQPFNTPQDYQNFIERSQGFVLYIDSVIEAMREGITEGVVLPEAIIKKIVPQLSVHIVNDTKDSVFYGPVAMLDNNDEISATQKQKIRSDYNDLILNTLVPTYAKFKQFIVEQYLPHARTTVGLSELPNGAAWYEYKIEQNTTLQLTAKEIHEFGKQEVARILNEMNTVKDDVGFDGDLKAFFKYLQDDEQFYWNNEADVIKAYTDVKNDINARLPALFEVLPKADYEVRPVEAFRAASSAGASYQGPAPDGSRPGIFYINTHNLKAQPKFILETLSIHEASPGHHFQISIQQELKDLPMFRKFGGYTVFSEGWALYAESLGKEMNMFTDPYQWYGRLSDEQLRAMRLVVDTGLHAFGWTREQAIQYMVDNSSLALSDITSEVERYISIPGQALAYKTGQRAIRAMRTNAEQQLGDKFDVRKFHTQILTDGALPMPILENKINAWVETQR